MIRNKILPVVYELSNIRKISGVTSKNGRNDAKRLNINIVTVSDDAKPKMPKKQRKQNKAGERFANHYPMRSEI